LRRPLPEPLVELRLNEAVDLGGVVGIPIRIEQSLELRVVGNVAVTLEYGEIAAQFLGFAARRSFASCRRRSSSCGLGSRSSCSSSRSYAAPGSSLASAFGRSTRS
jgi:hypothetical protein